MGKTSVEQNKTYQLVGYTAGNDVDNLEIQGLQPNQRVPNGIFRAVILVGNSEQNLFEQFLEALNNGNFNERYINIDNLQLRVETI
jgi:hypothetical protein